MVQMLEKFLPFLNQLANIHVFQIPCIHLYSGATFQNQTVPSLGRGKVPTKKNEVDHVI